MSTLIEFLIQMHVRMGFFRLQTSYSNLLKQVGILNSFIQGGAIRSYLLMKGFVVRTMLLSVCFLLCKLEVNNQCNQSPIESRNWNFLAFYEKVCWYNLNSIEKTVLRSNGLCRTWYYSQFGLYDNSTGVGQMMKMVVLMYTSCALIVLCIILITQV